MLKNIAAKISRCVYIMDRSLQDNTRKALAATRDFFDLVAPHVRHLPELHALRVNAMAGNYYHLSDDQIRDFVRDDDKMNAMFAAEFDKRFPAKAKKATTEKITADAVVHGNMLLHEYAQYLQNDNLPALDPPKDVIITYKDEDLADYKKFVAAALAEVKAHYRKHNTAGRYYTMDDAGEKTYLKRSVYESLEDLQKVHNANKRNRKYVVDGVEKLFAQAKMDNRMIDQITEGLTEKGIFHRKFRDNVRLEVIDHAMLKGRAKYFESKIKELKGTGGDISEFSKNLTNAKKELNHRKKWYALDPVKAKKHNLEFMRASHFAAEGPKAVTDNLKDIIARALEIEKKYGV